MRLNSKKQVKKKLNSNNEAIKLHNIKLANTEKVIMKVQTDFKQIFLQQQGDQISLCQKNPKDGVQIK